MTIERRCLACGVTGDVHAVWCGDSPYEAPTLTAAKIKSDGGSSGYYQLPAAAVEIQDLVEYRNMNFAVGNIFKAAYRMGQKAGNDELYEIRKIIWYANRELVRLKSQQEKA
jgi:hypothetical protein